MKKSLIYGQSIVITIVLLFGAGVIQGFAHNNATPFENEYIIPLSFENFELSFGTKIANNEEFTTIELIGESFSTNIGQAKLPMMKAIIEIPQGSDPNVAITSEDWESTTLSRLNLPEQIIPLQPSVMKDEGPAGSAEFVIDNEYYTQNHFLPVDIANIADTGSIRGRKFALVEVSPIQYNPSSGELKILKSCNIEIIVEECNLEKTYSNMQRYYTPTHETFLETLFDNYGDLEKEIVFSQKDSEGYLFIVYDDFYDEIQPLVTMKNNKGYDVTVTMTSEIPGGVSVQNIEQYIFEAFTTWTTPPAYILLVGDTAQVPTKTSGLEWGVDCSDLYYVTIDEDDFIPDIYIGRFPANTPDQVTVLVDKTIYYEEGDFPSDEWIKKGAFIASSDHDRLAEETHNYVIDNYLTPNEYTCDKIYEYFGGSTSDITDAVNDGRSLCVYSGHGYSGGWGCVPFDQGDVNSLTNVDMYPLVCSHACSTSPFTITECYGETWVLAEDKGGIAFWGASAGTMWDEDDILERGMFQGWWEDGLTTIGGMTDMGLFRVYENYSGGGSSRYYYEGYNVLGDPSIVVVGSTGGGVNQPPDTPDTPVGPENGEAGIEYIFTTSTEDPDNDDVYYMWNWGNEISDWIGPYNSGEIVEFPHTWHTGGEFDIKVIAKDESNEVSSWSDITTINIIEVPIIAIGEITGGFGVSAVIENIGAVEAENVEWTITIDGLVLFGKEKTGSFEKIMPGFGPVAKTGFIFGLGPVDITVTSGEAEKTTSAKLFGPFVHSLEE